MATLHFMGAWVGHKVTCLVVADLFRRHDSAAARGRHQLGETSTGILQSNHEVLKIETGLYGREYA